MSEVESTSELKPSIEKQTLLYCRVCTMPPEYCEFGPAPEKCKKWLFDNESEVYDKLYSDAPSATDDGPTSAETRAARKAAEKIKNEEIKKDKARVTIKRIERNKRKFITSISGLEVLGVDLKKASKLFAGKLACGASVTKNNQGADEIVVQGDVSDFLLELIPKTWSTISEDKIDLVEDKKNKKTEEATAPTKSKK
ncbi:Translation machinery-associated protein 22 [Entomophthora muscae]|uniref:Translation machinery-associated protein 22 n=1 Tax=Entomophthora muscae TaxID=34485 RepID=A0ACC2S1Y4_9FUNG|nr:Translation machinery-associated protein 22 [Entomophthora muscae]